MSRPTQPVSLQRDGYFEGVIDIYVANEEVKLAEAKRLGVTAVFYRTSVGLIPAKDDRVAYHRAKKEARDLSLLWGAFHVVSNESVDDQLTRFLDIEDGSDGATVMAFDWESTSRGEMKYVNLRDLVQKFGARQGYYPMLYGGHEFREEKGIVRGDKLFGNCPLWYVRHCEDESGLHIPIRTWKTYTLWQFDDQDRVNHSPYPSAVLKGADFSRFKGTEAELRSPWPFRVTYGKRDGG